MGQTSLQDLIFGICGVCVAAEVGGMTVIFRADNDASGRSEKVVVSYHRALPRALGGEGSLPYWTLCSAKTLGYGGKDPLPAAKKERS